MNLLINHLGYKINGYKKAVLEAPPDAGFTGFLVREADSDKTVYEDRPETAVHVAGWRDWYFSILDFSGFSAYGGYYIMAVAGSQNIRSQRFEIRDDPYLTETLSVVLENITSQRCAGAYDEADRSMSFFGRRADRVDVHGGWYDASADASKYLSHLSYANYLNPQQTPLVVWSLAFARDLVLGQKKVTWKYLPERITAEAIYGADFLVRMQDPEGYFYMTVYDGWSLNPRRREICSFSTLRGIKSDEYRCAYRQGGGLAIAALARVSTLDRAGDYDPHTYLETAKRGFYHLEENNLRYLDDGSENIIDDYCALLAACELFLAVREPEFLQSAEYRAERLLARISDDDAYSGWWRADDNGKRPFFHASDAGMPLVALMRFLDLPQSAQKRAEIISVIRKSLEFELTITREVNNPFGYARQYVKPVGGPKKGAFFFPHHNESGYWWQGESARLASLSTAALLAAGLYEDDAAFISALRRYAQDQLDWILGLNPFDVCMLHGKGRNNPAFKKGDMGNTAGGICNGITAGLYDELDIDFLPETQAHNPAANWRWVEQWLPHAAWYILAVTAGTAIP
jgi:hypothetical protein